ncbi:MAG: POTRA domain-containing protein [Candidatus Omnitrophota bacterium]
MKAGRLSIFLMVLFSLLFYSKASFSQTPSEMDKIDREIDIDEKMRERIEETTEMPKIKEEEETFERKEGEEAVFIKQIDVVGVTLFKKEIVRGIVDEYENKELSLREIQKIADLITDLYRRKNYLTSRAYIPPQDLSKGVLEIRVLEGIMGSLTIKGNKYFSSELFEKKMRLKQGDSFNNELLRKSLVRINEHPNRHAKAILVPGKVPGQTDVVLEVEDKKPFTAGLEYDNFGSRYIRKYRYSLKCDHGNITGHDDILTLKLLKTDHENSYLLSSLRYLLPFWDTFEVGFFATKSRLRLLEELEPADVRGKSTIYSLFLNKYLVDEETLDIRLTSGFDYKHIRNYQVGNETSRDEMRIAKGGFDVDKIDKYGRTIFVNEFSYGIPDIMQGLDDVDVRASRTGAGGKFTKYNAWLLRLHKLPLNLSLLWKNQLQVSPYILTSSEQFQGGGILNNRGYPPAEKVGDEGLSSVMELSLPLTMLPESWEVPICKNKLNKTLSAVGFFDFAHLKLRNPQAGEEKTETLRSLGCGLRLNVPDKDLSVRLEFGWPLDETPSDGDHFRTWAEVTWNFY